MARSFYITAGFISLGLGVLGAFLPVMPTTCFVILSAYFFGKSSARLESWVLQHKKWGPVVLHWRMYRAIPLKAKILACSGMFISTVIIFLSPMSWGLKTLSLTALALSAAYVVTRPSSKASIERQKMSSAPQI